MSSKEPWSEKPFWRLPRAPRKSQLPHQNVEHTAATPSPLRATLFTSRYYHDLHARIWNWIFISLGLDLILLFTVTPWLAPDDITHSLHVVLISTGALAVIARMYRDVIIDLLFAARNAQDELLHRRKYGVWIALGALLLFTFVDIAVKTGGASLLSLGLAIVVTIGAIKPIRKALRERAEKAQQLQQDRTLWVEQANFALFIVSLSPLIAARVFSATAILLALVESWPHWVGVLYWLASVATILALRPLLAEYTFSCLRCGVLTSRALRQLGFCPPCAQVSGYTSFTNIANNPYGAPNKNLDTLPPIEPRAPELAPFSLPETLRDWLEKLFGSSGRRKS